MLVAFLRSGRFKLAGLQDAAAAGASSRPNVLKLSRDAQTLTDVHSGEKLPEVELISLVEEQIPKYKLRADTLTSFTGYENQDWFIPSPALKPEEISTPLTPEQIRETFNYFLLCSTRVSQMTKTYNDIEAVTRLLEEKEKDIELTARIGKELLAHNAKLESSVAALEVELKQSSEKITQLSHELLKKTELIQILTNDVDDSASEAGTPTGDPKPTSSHFEMLQKRIALLENENSGLRQEAFKLAEQTEDCEQREATLVADLVAQLDASRSTLNVIGLESERSHQMELDLKERIDYLETKLQATEEKLYKAEKDNEEYLSMISISRETQCELATELAELKEKHAEVLSALEELRETARKTKKKSQPTVRAGPLYPSLHTSVPIQNPDSIAAELECSLFSEISLDSGISASSGLLPNYKKVFETVRCASRTGSVGSNETSLTNSPAPRIGKMSLTPSAAAAKSYRTSAYSLPTFDSASVSDTEEQSLNFKEPPEDLEAALQRLTPAAIDARRAALSAQSAFCLDDCPTPDSILSNGSSGYIPWKTPDKLQIVKPIEGSLTLHHWSELATPSLGGLLEEMPGVKIRGGAELEDLGLQMYSLADFEEDDDIHPGKSFCDTTHVFTYTNSTVMHPDDMTSVTPSVRGTQMCPSETSSRMSSRVSSVASTPASRSRRNSTSTFSYTPGLANLLYERGIRAATPSAFISPQYTPTATPCNSPTRSPTPTEEESYSSLGLPGFLMSSGAEMLRRALGTAKSPTTVKPQPKTGLARPDRKAALTGIRLAEKLERVGIEEILRTDNDPTTLHQTGLRRGKGPPTVLGVPGKPGRGELDARLSELPARPQFRQRGARQVRQDLGSVPSKPPPATPSPTTSSTLGTLSSLLFGRKGGLL